MGIATIIQQTTVTSIGSVVITDIVEGTDGDQPTFTREIRVLDLDNKTIQFTLRLVGDNRLSVELTAPSAVF